MKKDSAPTLENLKKGVKFKGGEKIATALKNIYI